MIRPININLNAAHPELPLVEATTFTGAPSSVFIRGVPKAVGNWSITAVSVAVTYPDNTTTARAAVESAEGVWVATIPGTATSGRTAAGFKIMADGIDENGAAVTGYVLGFADFSVLSFMPVPAPGDTFYLLRYFDQAPATPKEGDAAKIDGVLKFYNGTAWEAFAAPPTLDDAVTPTSANGVKSSGIWSAIWGALSALPAGFSSLYDWCVSQLAGKLDKSGGTVTGDINMPTGLLYAGDVVTRSYFDFSKPDESSKYLDSPEHSGKALTDADILDSSSALGAAFDGKQSALSAQQLANIAAVPNKANASDLRYTLPETVTTISTASSEVISGETVYYGAATLADRTQNQVLVLVALDELRVTIPPAVSGKVRDFGLLVGVGLGEGTALAAPALVPVAPTGETITMMNAEGEMPTLADGTTTASGLTVLYFTEIGTGTFLVKGEQIQGVA